MRAIIHIGMHKTGSSSIQNTLASAPLTGPKYLLSDNPNNSSIVRHVFESPGEAKGTAAVLMRDVKDVGALRTERRKLLEQALDAVDTDFIISSERLSLVDEIAVGRMKAILDEYCDAYSVIAYVRSPRSWISSAFQQKIKGIDSMMKPFARLIKWPVYRSRFEKYDHIFGRSNVELVKFDRSALHKNDVVADFCRRVGIDDTAITPVQSNNSLSLEALALIYIKRRHAGTRDWAEHKPRQRFIDDLRRIGTEKFALSEEIITPMVEANRADLAWIDARLGETMEDGPVHVARPVASERDLVDAGVAAAPLLDTITPGLSPDDPTPEKVAAVLRDLFALYRAQEGRQTRVRRTLTPEQLERRKRRELRQRGRRA